MEVNCIFDSNSGALRAIWEKGIALFGEILPAEVAAKSAPFGFLTYMRAYLCLIGDRERARTLFQNAGRAFSDAGDIPRLSAFFIALEHYDTYADDGLFIREMIRQYAGPFLHDPTEFSLTGDFSGDALFLGAWTAIDRLRSKSGQDANLTARLHLLERFNGEYFDTKERLYRERTGEFTPASFVLPLAFGFANESSREAARKWLIEESFCVPRDLRLLLYDALQAEELSDILMPTLFEGGLPGAQQTPSDLAGVICIVTHLCGVDIKMMGQGIQASIPHFPHGVTYSLSIPTPHTYMTFESEDYPGALVY